MEDLLFTYLLGVVSFGFLVLGAWCVGEGGEILGEKYDASVVGGLIIAWLNTAPEAIFFVTALHSNNPSFAVGAVAGSTIVVSTIAVGACLIIGSKARASNGFLLQPGVKTQCVILCMSCVVPVGIVLLGFNPFCALVGIASYLAFIVYSLQGETVEETLKKDEREEEKDLELGQIEVFESADEHDQPTWKGVAYLMSGALCIFIFSTPFIQSVVVVAEQLEISSTLLAFFLAPIASEAPEILEAISLSKKGHSQSINVAFSELIGGTVTKTTLLCGILCVYGVFRDFVWLSPNYEVSLLLLALCAGAAGSIGAWLSPLTSRHGVALLCLFVFTGILQVWFNATPLPEIIELAATSDSTSI
mmetsp:Transcript_6492/g.19685  ORF Transcript_6492/g.19685 Transcript_6492/m.19685 type:complete len:361 (+) Transcript_6492:170-1252(+)|eukprot:CAMPEP_0177657778 /NCGR_PEP_ID=MMETSP0447-20121125/16405_1 /TAXON_ID=0 /ORGANISM="Stygamoeba regulata, Strain BSH-02190019" /LENGTH=360 /DNA_ID=CAMNT_0019162233 /DNA_START=173 /DNA_END=1255 /DNA_ORIENTATION=-